MARLPQVNVVARDTGDRLQPASTNEALQLAAALGDVSPEARQFTATVAKDFKDKASAQARTDALRTSGAAFKDAVDQGLIERTQNPWYMSAYHKEAAQVDATSRLAQLQQDSQSWEERSDTQQYQDRLNREVGEIGASYQGEEQQEGFLSAANPMLQQTIAANSARNVQTVNSERLANAGSLAAQAVKTLNVANGGDATGAQIAEGLVAQRAEFLATGGSSLEWDSLVVNAVTTAAFDAGDPDLLEVLKSEELGNLYDRPELAADIENSAYRVRQGAVDKLQYPEQQRRAAADAEAATIRPILIEELGEALFTGDLDPIALFRQYRDRGFSFDGFQAAINQVNRDVGQTQSLQAARFKANSLDPSQGLATINLFTRAARDPLTPGLQGDIETAYLRGDIDQGDATKMINQAQANGEQAARGSSGSRGGGGGGSSQDSGGAAPFRPRNLTQMNQRLSQLSASTTGIARNRGMREIQGDDAEKVAKSAAEAWLGVRPGDYTGALNAGAGALARWGQAQVNIASRRQQRRTPSAPRPSGTGNTPSRNNRD